MSMYLRCPHCGTVRPPELMDAHLNLTHPGAVPDSMEILTESESREVLKVVAVKPVAKIYAEIGLMEKRASKAAKRTAKKAARLEAVAAARAQLRKNAEAPVKLTGKRVIPIDTKLNRTTTHIEPLVPNRAPKTQKVNQGTFVKPVKNPGAGICCVLCGVRVPAGEMLAHKRKVHGDTGTDPNTVLPHNENLWVRIYEGGRADGNRAG